MTTKEETPKKNRNEYMREYMKIYYQKKKEKMNKDRSFNAIKKTNPYIETREEYELFKQSPATFRFLFKNRDKIDLEYVEKILTYPS